MLGAGMSQLRVIPIAVLFETCAKVSKFLFQVIWGFQVTQISEVYASRFVKAPIRPGSIPASESEWSEK